MLPGHAGMADEAAHRAAQACIPQDEAPASVAGSACTAQEHTPAQAPVVITPREKQILGHLAHGLSNKEIARFLKSKVRTVETHLDNLYQKLQVNSRTRAIAVARARGILPREQ
jgi:DNA-binding NarL/FixJ family response regulator